MSNRRKSLTVACLTAVALFLFDPRLLLFRKGQEASAQDQPTQPRQAIPSIQLVPGQGENLARVRFEVSGIDRATLQSLAKAGWNNSQWAQLFALTVDDPDRPVLDDRPDQVTIAGRFEIADDALRFYPRFPLDRGTRYRAAFHPACLPSTSPTHPTASSITALFTLPEQEADDPARVLKVEPAIGVVPENLLRLYLYFSAAMSRGEAYHRIQLLDASGHPIDLPFLELGEELWDPTGQRLTLLFDPGRIKRGLVPNLEAGPVLQEGHDYTLVVDKNWPDANGQPLASPFRHNLQVGPAARQGLDPSQWKIQPPPINTRDALAIEFPSPLDHALAHRLIHVEDASSGSPLTGEATVSADSRLWRFVPEQAWDVRPYRLAINPALEDVAGNRIGRPFEVDETSPITSRIITQDVYLPFKAIP